jgi:hypothetical protein
MLLVSDTTTLFSSLGAGKSKSNPLPQYRGMKAKLRLFYFLGDSLATH